MPTISKSRYVSGVQCEKKLYYDIYHKVLKIKVSEQQEELFSSGHFIGHLAQQLYPNGKDATPENYSDFSHSFDGLMMELKQFTRQHFFMMMLWLLWIFCIIKMENVGLLKLKAVKM
jgi:hypothetical protein